MGNKTMLGSLSNPSVSSPGPFFYGEKHPNESARRGATAGTDHKEARDSAQISRNDKSDNEVAMERLKRHGRTCE